MKKQTKTKTENGVMVVTDKSTPKTGDVVFEYTDALGISTIAPDDIKAANSSYEYLCLNLLAGTVHDSIREAHAKQGGITRLFPKMYEADKNALRICLDSTPDALRAGWAAFVATKKRIRGVTLQALKKGIAEPSEPKASLRDALILWAQDKNDADIDPALFDILVSFEIIATE